MLPNAVVGNPAGSIGCVCCIARRCPQRRCGRVSRIRYSLTGAAPTWLPPSEDPGAAPSSENPVHYRAGSGFRRGFQDLDLADGRQRGDCRPDHAASETLSPAPLACLACPATGSRHTPRRPECRCPSLDLGVERSCLSVHAVRACLNSCITSSASV
jgi:hypothetical protein